MTMSNWRVQNAFKKALLYQGKKCVKDGDLVITKQEDGSLAVQILSAPDAHGKRTVFMTTRDVDLKPGSTLVLTPLKGLFKLKVS